MFSVFQSAFNLIVFNTVFSILVLLSSKVLMAEEILPEIVVTATRTAQTVDDSLAAVTVITREQIEQSSALTVPDLLRDVVGLETVRNGGIGQASSVFMRGTNSDHVLVLIDGIKIGSATLGQVPFSRFVIKPS
jgi:vitamin B12 transporter